MSIISNKSNTSSNMGWTSISGSSPAYRLAGQRIICGSIWALPLSKDSGASDNRLVEIYRSASVQGVRLRLDGTDGKFAIRGQTNTGDTDAGPNSTIVPEMGMWYHVGFVLDYYNKLARIYVNGRLDGETTSIGTWGATSWSRSGSTPDRVCGGTGSTTANWNGFVSEVALWGCSSSDNTGSPLNDQDFAALANGVPPFKIRERHICGFVPLDYRGPQSGSTAHIKDEYTGTSFFYFGASGLGFLHGNEPPQILRRRLRRNSKYIYGAVIAAAGINGTAQSGIVSTGVAAGNATFAGTGTAAIVSTGAAAGGVALATAAGTSAAAVSVSATASLILATATASSALTSTGTAVGALVTLGSATSAIVSTGAASASIVAAGNATSALATTATAAAAATLAGVASAAVQFGATATAAAAGAINGTAQSDILSTGSAAAVLKLAGTASSALQFGSTASAGGTITGTATAALSFAPTSAGNIVASGVCSSAIVLGDAAAGAVTRGAFASVAIVCATSATSAIVFTGTCESDILAALVVAATLQLRGSATSTLLFGVTATVFQFVPGVPGTIDAAPAAGRIIEASSRRSTESYGR